MTFFASRLSPLLALVTRVLLSGIKYQSGNAGRLLSLFPLVSTCMRPMQNARTLAHKGMSYRYTVDLYRERGEGVRYVAAFGIRDNDKIINRYPLSLSLSGRSLPAERYFEARNGTRETRRATGCTRVQCRVDIGSRKTRV